jgi:diacylglycerol kinase family enzyme
VLQAVKSKLEGAGIRLEVQPTQRARHAFDMAKDANFDGFDALIVIGGDG